MCVHHARRPRPRRRHAAALISAIWARAAHQRTGPPAKGKLKNRTNFVDGNQLGQRCWFGANVKATLYDAPRTEVVPNSSQRFETTAVVLEGSAKGKYLAPVLAPT